MKLLQTVPGGGPIVALTAIAVFGNVAGFRNAKAATSYSGLVPTKHQSGNMNRHGHINKRGSWELRAMLCEAAQPLLRPPVRPARLQDGDRRVAHCLSRILYAMLRDGTEFNRQRLGVQDGPFTRPITRMYRLTPRHT